ncbi:MAG: hypothetical protein F6K25_14340 [Okeania sp. SIO2G4]|nr:hypothetical protein [Okeania sp. SIO2H7]NEP92408.1 hypothetical protein [Okeania sp. SIO2F5]NEQ91809.1 hypothetical protein [Okeania sp. SIO2G4]
MTKRSLAQLPVGWDGDLRSGSARTGLLAISNRPREWCDPATTPARLRNAHQEKRMISDLKNGTETIPV